MPNVKTKKRKHKMRGKSGGCSGARVKLFVCKSKKKYLKKSLPNVLHWSKLSP